MWNNCESNIFWDSIKWITEFIWYDIWVPLKYIDNWTEIDFTFYHDGWIKIEKNGKTMRLNVELNDKSGFNKIIWSVLNNLTSNNPNRKRIWREVDNIYDLLTWKALEKKDITTCSVKEHSNLLDEIIDGWEVIWDLIYWIILDLIFECFWDKIDIMKISWQDLLNNKEFRKKINLISQELWCKPIDLYIVMHSESGINPRAVNDNSKATALIQFMPKTAKWLWTSVEKLLGMSAIEQLKYVKMFLDQNNRWKILDTTEKLYACVLYPRYLNYIDHNKSFVFWSEVSYKRAKKIAEQNSVISKYSRRADKLIDGYAFARYVNEQKKAFEKAYNLV